MLQGLGSIGSNHFAEQRCALADLVGVENMNGRRLKEETRKQSGGWTNTTSAKTIDERGWMLPGRPSRCGSGWASSQSKRRDCKA